MFEQILGYLGGIVPFFGLFLLGLYCQLLLKLVGSQNQESKLDKDSLLISAVLLLAVLPLGGGLLAVAYPWVRLLVIPLGGLGLIGLFGLAAEHLGRWFWKLEVERKATRYDKHAGENLLPDLHFFRVEPFEQLVVNVGGRSLFLGDPEGKRQLCFFLEGTLTLSRFIDKRLRHSRILVNNVRLHNGVRLSIEAEIEWTITNGSTAVNSIAHSSELDLFTKLEDRVLTAVESGFFNQGSQATITRTSNAVTQIAQGDSLPIPHLKGGFAQGVYDAASEGIKQKGVALNRLRIKDVRLPDSLESNIASLALSELQARAFTRRFEALLQSMGKTEAMWMAVLLEFSSSLQLLLKHNRQNGQQTSFDQLLERAAALTSASNPSAALSMLSK